MDSFIEVAEADVSSNNLFQYTKHDTWTMEWKTVPINGIRWNTMYTNFRDTFTKCGPYNKKNCKDISTVQSLL